jgi:type I restriction enzyme R subunit
MQDHGLFQAICRVNRLDGDDKDYGYIVDYRDLFNSLESAITDYTSGALDGYEKKDIDGLLSNRIDKAREDLDEALERVRALCEPVEPPKNTLQYQRYFCAAEQGNAEDLKANEPKRVELYKSVVAALARAYGNLANEMGAARYSEQEAAAIRDEVAHYASVRDEVKLGAGEDVDFKQYEAGMRHLLDTYISAEPSEVISDFQDTGLIGLIVRLGAGAIDRLPEGIKKDPEAVAETIANNIRTVIIDERPLNPKYYDRMSDLLDAILEERRRGALEYRDYLARLLDHAAKLGKAESETQYPAWADNGARRALVDFFDSDSELAERIDRVVLNTKPDAWVGDAMKERMVKRAIRAELPDGFGQLDDLIELVKARNEYH